MDAPRGGHPPVWVCQARLPESVADGHIVEARVHGREVHAVLHRTRSRKAPVGVVNALRASMYVTAPGGAALAYSGCGVTSKHPKKAETDACFVGSMAPPSHPTFAHTERTKQISNLSTSQFVSTSRPSTSSPAVGHMSVPFPKRFRSNAIGTNDSATALLRPGRVLLLRTFSSTSEKSWQSGHHAAAYLVVPRDKKGTHATAQQTRTMST